MYKYGSLTQQQLKQMSDPYYSQDRKIHIQQVLNQAKKLKAGPLSPQQQAAIYWHDSAKLSKGAQNHAQNSAKLAAKILKKYYTPQQMRVITTAIRQHGPGWEKKTPLLAYTQPQSQLLGVADDWNITNHGPGTLPQKIIKYNAPRHPQFTKADWMKMILQKSNMDKRLPAMKVYDKQWQEHVQPVRDYVNKFNLNKLDKLLAKYGVK